jgi:epoxyqueuosine reductase
MSSVTEKTNSTAVLRDDSFELGFSLFGTTDISGIRDSFLLPDNLKSRVSFAVSLGKRLVAGVLDDLVDGPTPLYFHHYRQINYFLDRGALMLASRIQDRGFRAVPIPASQVIDWTKQRAHLSHKRVGEMAGLGWIGRNNLLVTPEFGSRFRLVTVLTDMPLEAGNRSTGDCGECRKCLRACPAKAIKERREDFDHIECFKMLKEFRNKGLVGQYICGLCVKACSGRPLSPPSP